MPSMNLCAEGAVMQPFHSVLIELYGVQLSQDLYGSRATFAGSCVIAEEDGQAR